MRTAIVQELSRIRMGMVFVMPKTPLMETAPWEQPVMIMMFARSMILLMRTATVQELSRIRMGMVFVMPKTPPTVTVP